MRRKGIVRARWATFVFGLLSTGPQGASELLRQCIEVGKLRTPVAYPERPRSKLTCQEATL